MAKGVFCLGWDVLVSSNPSSIGKDVGQDTSPGLVAVIAGAMVGLVKLCSSKGSWKNSSSGPWFMSSGGAMSAMKAVKSVMRIGDAKIANNIWANVGKCVCVWER